MGIEVDMTGDKLNSLPPSLHPHLSDNKNYRQFSDEPKPAECTETVIRPYPYRSLIWTDRLHARTDGQPQKAFIV